MRAKDWRAAIKTMILKLPGPRERQTLALRAWSTAVFIVGAVALASAQGQTTQAAPAPGGMRLLSGYQHRVTPAMDTMQGVIWTEGGLEIRYETGAEAGNQAREYKGSRQALWSQTQEIRGVRLELVMTTDNTLVATFAGY